MTISVKYTLAFDDCLGWRQKTSPNNCTGVLFPAYICILYWNKLLVSLEYLVYLTYTKNEVDHAGTFWTAD
jgi:hypothetical protein